MTAANAMLKGAGVYDRLMAADSAVDPLDRHVLASAIAAAMEEPEAPLTESLGLDQPTLARLLETVFPGAYLIGDLVATDTSPGENAIEEPDYRALLLAGRDNTIGIDHWLAHIVVRRSLRPEHLWISLGLRNRRELSDMLHRHFPAVAARNIHGMRWKKFFYREMCQAEGVYVCKSPVCDICPDFDGCYGVDE